MKKYIITLVLTLFSTFIVKQTTFAQAKDQSMIPEKVTFIYIHGVNEPDPEDFQDEIDGLHKYFANKLLGKYIISPEHYGVFWGQMSKQGPGPELYKAGLLKINSDHNMSAVKKTTEIKPSLILNPYYKFCLLGDSGSKASAVFFRNLINSYNYDIIWIASEKNHLEEIFDLMQEKIDKANGKFVIVGHSLGSVLAVSFIIHKINLDPKDPYYKKSNFDNFVGLITSGDVNNSFHSDYLAEQVLPGAYDKDKYNLIRFFIENNKFWISYNHRNDIIGIDLAPSITSYNNKGPGFIISKTNHKNFLKVWIGSLKFWDHDDGDFLAHQWLFLKPDQFAKAVLRAYNEQKKLPNK